MQPVTLLFPLSPLPNVWPAENTPIYKKDKWRLYGAACFPYSTRTVQLPTTYSKSEKSPRSWAMDVAESGDGGRGMGPIHVSNTVSTENLQSFNNVLSDLCGLIQEKTFSPLLRKWRKTEKRIVPVLFLSFLSQADRKTPSRGRGSQAEWTMSYQAITMWVWAAGHTRTKNGSHNYQREKSGANPHKYQKEQKGLQTTTFSERTKQKDLQSGSLIILARNLAQSIIVLLQRFIFWSITLKCQK